MPPGYTALDFAYILPELILAMGVLVLLVADLMTPRDRQGWLGWFAVGILGASAFALLPLGSVDATVARGLIAVDGFAYFFKLIFLLTAAITILMSMRYLTVEGAPAGEYYFLILCATLGMMFMAGGIDLITIFIGLETMAISFYILVGYLKPNRRSNEAAVKYFLLGAFSLGLLLYGMSILYGVTGTTQLRPIMTALSGQEVTPVLLLGMMLVIGGIGFKIAAVPFHMWAPDVYEGAPTPITAFLSVGSKAAAFAMLIRIFFEGLGPLHQEWSQVFWVLAVVTMTVGNVAALTQSNLKRMLAYSSIAHAGYILMGVIVGTPRGLTAILVYLMVYLFTQLGAFAVVVALRRRDTIGDELKDLTGLYQRSPFAAVAMLLFMLSLGGIPPTAGFMGKLWLFGAAIDSGYVWLAVIGVLNSAISLYYYIRVVVFVWIKSDTMATPLPLNPAMTAVLAITIVGTIVFGTYPAPLFEFADASVRTLGLSQVTLFVP